MTSNRRTATLTLLALALGAMQPAHAAFIHTGTVTFGADPIAGMKVDVAFDGSNFYAVSRMSDEWSMFDGSGGYLGATTFSLAGNDNRSIAVERGGATVWVAGLNGMVASYDASGAMLSSFDSGFGNLNALAFDSSNNSLWLADYRSQIISNVDAAGNLISQFKGGHAWTGLAYDEVSDTLLALDAADSIYEFTTSGRSLGVVYAGASFPGSANEFGLAYDSATGNLFVQPMGADFIQVLSDPARVVVPEPGTLSLLGAGLLAFGFTRRRRQR